MNTLIAVAIAPCGTGEEMSAYVGEVVRVIRESGLPNRTNSMFTEIEGEWDVVMAVVKKATMVLADKGIRTEVVLKADIRPGYTDMMHGVFCRWSRKYFRPAGQGYHSGSRGKRLYLPSDSFEGGIGARTHRALPRCGRSLEGPWQRKRRCPACR